MSSYVGSVAFGGNLGIVNSFFLRKLTKTMSARGKVQSKSDIFLPLVDLQCNLQLADLLEKSLPHYLYRFL